MNIITRIKPVLFIVPFIWVLYSLYLFRLLPTREKRHAFNEFLYHLITEADIDELLFRANIRNTKTRQFQVLRISISLLFGGLYVIINHTVSGLTISIIMAILIYKIFYLYLRNLESNRIKKLNQELPYGIKNIVYLNYIYPVSNAIEKAITYVPDSFKDDLSLLLNEIDKDPNSYEPYSQFVRRYDGRLEQLDFYLRILYRMSMSSNEQKKLLDNMNSSISSQINRVRAQKNTTINTTISYLGLIPVVLVTIMLGYLLVVFSNAL